MYANRGLAGIDGTVATAIGISLAGYYPTGTGTVGVPHHRYGYCAAT
ncbi:2-succinyl-5-enolpyruvyl-6-hydroxy-3-cyclohexene-1-carboxylic-acid synthase [Rothia aeria]|uniref:2-succinyl-5-enolpyruvyl-6-hydroxy-3-cyclohexene-1-carboxylic-acid synthase n=1 Tax=Rothia aeria TaxID=172042 RepID=A0A2Z5R2K7_9MICC|nr:2-succinyl-5-enolpyruvyl-6-hydroxy-3-cyclohexene-1-carboxylic-acid synthase [Rothia aeria]